MTSGARNGVSVFILLMLCAAIFVARVMPRHPVLNTGEGARDDAQQQQEQKPQPVVFQLEHSTASAQTAGLFGGYSAEVASLQPEGYVQEGAKVDLSSAAFSLEVKDFEGNDTKFQNILYPSYSAAWNALKGNGEGMLPVNVVDAYGKEIFDSALAGISMQLESDKSTSKQQMLVKLRADVERKKSGMSAETYKLVSTFLDDAIKIGEGKAADGSPMVTAFMSDPVHSTPIGFWSWNDQLKTIFTQDRFLQTKFAAKPEPDSDEVLDTNNEAFAKLSPLIKSSKVYQRYAQNEQQMNNPFSYSSLLDAAPNDGKWEFIPACRSNETELQKELDRQGILLMDPMDEIIKRIKDGRLKFDIKPDSGYYDYQQHALAALLLADKNPEAAKIKFGEKYLKRLEEAFKTGMAKARESHVKSLEMFDGVATCAAHTPVPTITITPFLPVEPLPTVYVRYAEGFDYLLQKLPGIVGKGAQTWHPDEKPQSAYDRLEQARAVCYGMALISADELGLPRAEIKTEMKVSEKDALKAARNFIASADALPELARDPRFIVPVSFDPKDKPNRKIYCWGTVGVQIIKVHAEFMHEPAVSAPTGTQVQFAPRDYYLIADKFLAVTVPYAKGPLTRDQFRKVLDSSATLEEAKQKLEAGNY
jgi:hypothetical protein